MIYTDTGKYALRAVMHLAALADIDRPVPANEIAAAENIPPFYLAKVLKDLSNAGILLSVRGRGGGFKLARPPEEISALEVLEAAEDLNRRIEACVLGLDQCTDQAPCALHDYWTTFRDRTLFTLAELTVADLLEELRRKRRLALRETAP